MILRAHSKRQRPGNVIALVALLLTVLLGMAGYAIDGGMILTQKRTCQATADACAMAAACYFYQNYQTLTTNNLPTYQSGTGGPGGSSAANEAAKVGVANGFLTGTTQGANPPGSGITSATYQNGSAGAAGSATITVNFPPNITANSIYNGTGTSPSYDMLLDDGVVEVIVEYYQASYFTKVWGYNNIHITARAVARGNWVSPKNGVILLNYTQSGSLTDKGGGNGGGIVVTGGNFVVDSNSASAVVDTGNATITAPEFDVTGGVSAPASGIVTTPTVNNILTGLHPTPDPFAYLQSTATAQYSNLTAASAPTGLGTEDNPYVFKANYSYPSFSSSANPTYIKFSGSGMIGLNGFSTRNTQIVSDPASTGVVLYNNTGSFEMEGSSSGSMNYSGLGIGPASGGTTNPLAGFAFWQPLTNTSTIKFAGNASTTILGTLYAPTAELDVVGNGTTNNIGSQYVTSTMKSSGNGNTTVNYKGPQAAKTRVLSLIE